MSNTELLVKNKWEHGVLCLYCGVLNLAGSKSKGAASPSSNVCLGAGRRRLSSFSIGGLCSLLVEAKGSGLAPLWSSGLIGDHFWDLPCIRTRPLQF